MTEKQHIALVKVGEEFYNKFGLLIAETLSKLPSEIEGDALYYLQDKTSVFGSDYSKHMKEFKRK